MRFALQTEGWQPPKTLTAARVLALAAAQERVAAKITTELRGA